MRLFEPFHNTVKFPEKELFLHNIEIRRRMSEKVILSYRSQFQRNNKTKKYYHLLDFDCYIAEAFPISKYIDLLDKIHIIEKREFLRTVSEEFIDKMHIIE
ncbi:MAG: hypothetical protein ACFFG0_25305 [Candidatus Thorarchaeota archaeon]